MVHWGLLCCKGGGLAAVRSWTGLKNGEIFEILKKKLSTENHNLLGFDPSYL